MLVPNILKVAPMDLLGGCNLNFARTILQMHEFQAIKVV